MNILREIWEAVVKYVSLIGDGIRFVINAILGGATYIFGVGPVAVIGRLFGKKFLTIKIDPDAATYWEQSEAVRSVNEYYRQF